MIHIHYLDGCAPTPLGHYLKALGIFRLVAEQADPQARGWWHGERFRLATTLNSHGLENFFLTDYQPTPLVAPWNKGSGFYNNDPVLAPLQNSTAPRFQRLRDGIEASRKLMREQVAADDRVRSIKNETKGRHLSNTERNALKNDPEYKKRLATAERAFKALKQDLLPHCRLDWRGPHREWMDAALALSNDGAPQYASLLGTGGNDGRLDFTNNYMQRLNDVFEFGDAAGKPKVEAQVWLAGSLWQEAVYGYRTGSSVGQYLPGTAGGANNSNGPTADSLLNPFDFLLMLEGSVLFRASVSRRTETSAGSRAAAPFVVGNQGAGYASAGEADESARGEQWMPLWGQPLVVAELSRLLAEGRAQIGARAIREPLDLARSIARLGVARGIQSFQRYGYIERNGQANLAVPLGRFHVSDCIEPALACLDDLDMWLPRLRRQARGKDASLRLKQAERRLGDALFAAARHPDEAHRWQTVLLRLAAVEAVQMTGSGIQAGPIPRLRPAWIRVVDDGSVEMRLALSLALQTWRRNAREGSEPNWPDSVRRHWLPLKGSRFWINSEQRLQIGPEVVMEAHGGIDDAIAMVMRRLIEAAQKGERRLPLVAEWQAAANISDLSALLSGRVDLDRTLALARAMMALDRRQWNQHPAVLQSPQADDWPDEAWLIIRLALLPWPLADGREVGADAAIVRRLATGDAASAIALALGRLQAAGIATTVRTATVSAQTARLWAAALAFPITRTTAERFIRRLDPIPLRESA